MIQEVLEGRCLASAPVDPYAVIAQAEDEWDRLPKQSLMHVSATSWQGHAHMAEEKQVDIEMALETPLGSGKSRVQVFVRVHKR